MNTGEHISDYVVERVLGEGGMGEVYLARHTALDQQVAVKILDPEVARKSGVRERFIQEANIQAKLKHPNIVQVLTATKTDGGTPALIMEYVEGKSLSEVLELRGALPKDDALKIMGQVLSAVGYAHRQGVIHRDLKPSNVMVMASGEVKVTDFGIAKVLGSSKLTRTGTAMGSAHYMSPEQIRRPDTVDARSDIYSLGCMFYEVLTGRPPFGDKDESGTESDFEIKNAHISEGIPFLKNEKSDIPAWLSSLVTRMLEKEPENRFSNCDLIREEIDQYQTEPRDLNSIRNSKNSIKPADESKSETNLPGLEATDRLQAKFFSRWLNKKYFLSPTAAWPFPVTNIDQDETVPNNDSKKSESSQGHQKGKNILNKRLAAVLLAVVCVVTIFALKEDLYENLTFFDVTENTGKFVINPQFDYANYFSEGLAAIRIGDDKTGKYGFINKKGEIVISPQFDHAYAFSEELAAVCIGSWETQKCGFVNKEGKIIIKPEFDYVVRFSEGLAAVRMNSPQTTKDELIDTRKYGFIDKIGKMVIAPQFALASDFSEGLAAVLVGGWGGKYGYINKDGKIVVPAQFDWAGDFSEGLAAVQIGDWETGKYGFINKEGKIVVAPQFDRVYPFFEGLASVRTGDEKTGKYGFINKKGEMVISPQFDDAFFHLEGLAAVRIGDEKTGKYGAINKEGKFVISPQFDKAFYFREGLASVRVGDAETGKCGFINKKGEMVIQPQFDCSDVNSFPSFEDGLAAIRVGDLKSGKTGFIARR